MRQPHDVLHRKLWEKAGPNHRLQLHVGEWAKEIRRDYRTAWYLVQALRSERRIRLVGKHATGLATYEISDPNEFDPDEPPPLRPMRWE